jgi:hypothetical protein
MKMLGKLLVAAALAAVVAAAPSAFAHGSATFSVSSSLDGKKVLPIRSHWLGYTDLPRSQVAHVDFLVDGKVRWIEHNPPYNFASDENGHKMGYLITTWITPGLHRFAVRVTDTSGNSQSDTVTARVTAAPAPPAALAGTWTRISPGGSDQPFRGRWLLIFDRVGEWHLDPMGTGVVNQYAVGGHTLHLYAPIQMAPFNDGKTGINRDGHHDIGGNDCNMSGPFGRYLWSVSGDTLTLTRIYEGCHGRGKILTGTWSRIAGATR